MSEPASEDAVFRVALRRNFIRSILGWSGAFLGLSAAVGLLAGLFWVRVVALPAYTIAADGSAFISERGLAEFFAVDAWYSLVGALVCLGLGIIAWRWFAPLGWPVAPIGVVGSAIAGVVCLVFGQLIGPGSFPARLAAAAPGDSVPVDFRLHALSALVLWPLAGLLPILLASSLGRDEEIPRPVRSRRWHQHDPNASTPDRSEPPVSESGEVVGRDLDLLPPSAG